MKWEITAHLTRLRFQFFLSTMGTIRVLTGIRNTKRRMGSAGR